MNTMLRIKPETFKNYIGNNFEFSVTGKIVIYLIVSWLPVVFLDLLGLHSRFNNFLTTLNDTYFVLMLIIMLNFLRSVSRKAIAYSGNKYTAESITKIGKAVNKIVFDCGLLSTIGIMVLTYDRIWVKGIDYSVGARAARYQWFSIAKVMDTTIYGAIGNLLIPFSYVSLFFCILYFESLKKKQRVMGVLAGIGVPFLHAFLNGGRMNILVCFMFIVSVCMLRLFSGKRFLPKVNKFEIVVVVVGLLFYIIEIFTQSRLFGTLSIREFTILQVAGLNGEFSHYYDSTFLNLLIQILSYMYHGKWTTGMIMTIPSTETYGFYSCVPINGVLFSLGFDLRHNLDLLGGTFMNLPGTIYYDFGLIGVLFMPIMLSFIIHNAVAKYKKQTVSYSTLILLHVCMMLIISSPVAPVLNLGYVNFILVAFFISGIFLRYVLGVKRWIIF